MSISIDPRARALVLLALVSAIAGWLERRPPPWLMSDPLLTPFGLSAPDDPVAAMDSLLFPPAPPRRQPTVIDPNRASREEWIALPGIGPATADRIAGWLESGRSFHRAEDLGQVKGIGPKRIEQLRPWLRFPSAPVDSSSSRAVDDPGESGN